MIRLVIPGFVLLIGVLLTPNLAAACTCRPVESEAALAHSAAVFEARVIEIGAAAQGRLAVGFSVVRVWKGIDAEHVRVSTADNSAACGVTFLPDATYLVYADRGDSGLTVSACGRTRPIVDAEADLVKLGAGVVPVDPSPPEGKSAIGSPLETRASSAGCASCRVGRRSGAMTTTLGALLVGLLLAIRRRVARHATGRAAAANAR